MERRLGGREAGAGVNCALCTTLRDVQQNIAVQFDLVTLDIARGVYGWLLGHGIQQPLIIHSGYRDPRTNTKEGASKTAFTCEPRHSTYAFRA